MTHDLDNLLDWCRRCGRPYIEIVEGDLAECDGLPGVQHARYKEALAKAHAVFDPVVQRIYDDLTDKPQGKSE